MKKMTMDMAVKTSTRIMSKIECEEKSLIIYEILRKRRKNNKKIRKGKAKNRNVTIINAPIISLSSRARDG